MSKETQTLIYGLEEVYKPVELLRTILIYHRIVTLIGTLGAGKTTLIRQLLRSYGVSEPIISPTYTYVSIYTTVNGKRVYHFDLYRIGSLEEFFIAGFHEYLADEDSICLIEWPQIIESLLQQYVVCNVNLDYAGLEKRKISVEL